MDNKKKYLMVIITILNILLLTKFSEINVKTDTPGFSVVPVLEKNQIKPGLGYFNLLLNPNQDQILEFNIYNNETKPISIETTFGTSFTGDAGNILYTPNKHQRGPSLDINIKDYVKVPKEVTVPPHSKKIVKAQVRMPGKKFKGVIAGGFNFNQKINEKSKSSNTSTSIINRYSYVIGLVMQNSDDEVQPILNIGKIGASQRNSRNIISVNLKNSAKSYLLNMNVDAMVTSIEDKNIKYYLNDSSMEMAPNSSFNLAIPVSVQGSLKKNEISEPLKPGKYQMNMTIFGGKNDNGKYEKLINGQVTKYNYKWTFSENFIITGEQSRRLNSQDVTIKQTSERTWVPHILIIVVIFLIFVIFLLLFKQRKK